MKCYPSFSNTGLNILQCVRVKMNAIFFLQLDWVIFYEYVGYFKRKPQIVSVIWRLWSIPKPVNMVLCGSMWEFVKVDSTEEPGPHALRPFPPERSTAHVFMGVPLGGTSFCPDSPCCHWKAIFTRGHRKPVSEKHTLCWKRASTMTCEWQRQDRAQQTLALSHTQTNTRTHACLGRIYS